MGSVSISDRRVVSAGQTIAAGERFGAGAFRSGEISVVLSGRATRPRPVNTPALNEPSQTERSGPCEVPR